MADVAQHPRVAANATIDPPSGFLTADDLADYEVLVQDPTHVDYHGLDVYGMAPSSSGGTTVGESLNILEDFDLSAADQAQALHLYFEATAHAFADRNRYVGDPAFVDVPVKKLLDDRFAAERACGIDPAKAAVKPVAAGDVASYDGVCGAPRPPSSRPQDRCAWACRERSYRCGCDRRQAPPSGARKGDSSRVPSRRTGRSTGAWRTRTRRHRWA